MNIDKIIPCICNENYFVSSKKWYKGRHQGMPQLKVCGGNPHIYFDAHCPRCGRGVTTQHTSAYLALKAWNQMQLILRQEVLEAEEQVEEEAMTGKKEQIEKLAHLLRTLDMSGYDARVHGDYDDNVAEYLINSGVSVDPAETIKIKNQKALEVLIHEAMVAYLDYLEDLDQTGLIDNQKKSSFIAQYITNHTSDNGGEKA